VPSLQPPASLKTSKCAALPRGYVFARTAHGFTTLEKLSDREAYSLACSFIPEDLEPDDAAR
jgi:hypothetical protein